MNKRLLVPLDGSPLAEVALPYTEELAVRLGADIILLSVLSVPDPAKQNIMDGYLKKVKNEYPKTEVTELEEDNYCLEQLHKI